MSVVSPTGRALAGKTSHESIDEANSRLLDTGVIRWLLGLGWSLLAGHFVVGLVVDGLRAQIRPAPEAFDDTMPSTWEPDLRIPSWAAGLIERLFFTLAVAFDVSGSATAMMAWIAIKMAAHWNLLGKPDAPGALSIALGGLVSMFFALTGGAICRGLIRP